VKDGRTVDKDIVCRQLYSTCTANTLPRNPLKDLETSKEKVKYPHCEIQRTDDFVLLAKKEAVLQGMTEKLIKVGTSYGKKLM
jgi:hypothetical protein